MVDSTFKRDIDNQLDKIGDRCDRIIDANDLFPNPERIAKESKKIIFLANRILSLATTEQNENGTDDNRRSRAMPK